MPKIPCERCDALNRSSATACVGCGAPLPGPAASPPPLPGSARPGAGAPSRQAGARVTSAALTRRIKSRAERVAEEGVGERASARRRASFEMSNASALRLIVLAVGAAAVVGVTAWALGRPPAVDDAVAAFEQKWSAGDAAGVVTMIDGGSARAAARFEADLARRGWESAPPALGELVLERGEPRPATRWPCDGGELLVRWTRGPRGAWRIYSYKLPEWEPPSIADALRSFRAAWEGDSLAPLQAMTRDPRGRVARGLERLLEQRGWDDVRLPLGESYGSGARGERRRVRFRLAGGELRVTFEFWHPRWRVVGVKLPER